MTSGGRDTTMTAATAVAKKSPKKARRKAGAPSYER
jgi:hypothetical protein